MSRDNHSRRSGHLVGFLDIGSSKNCCLIVAPDKPNKRTALGATIVGASCVRSSGVKSGMITDLDEAEQAVRSCVSHAERMVGDTLTAVNVAFSCGRLQSQIFAANAEIATGVVSETDIGRCLRAGRSFAVREGRNLVHMNELGYRLDGQSGAKEPRGMAARRLTADLHAVTSDEGPLRNLSMLIEKCHLRIAGLEISPFSSAMAATSEEERRLGVAAIDIGGGTVKIAMFSEGRFVHADVISVGSDHITFDIARSLQTPFAEAERIKNLYGTLVSAQSDSHETFSYSLAGHEEGGLHHSNKADLAGIISHRSAMIASLVVERLERSGVVEYAGTRVVLTGGGSELLGLAGFMANRLGKSVRVARPSADFELAENLRSAAFSTAVGMVASAFSPDQMPMRVESRGEASQGYLGRVGNWLMSGL
ncbi:MAG: cell division protein FtsA [Alphaproteobacteria bacterium]|nr:cell division protein FtsA [Alphaproteobacteria bacterium]